MIRVDLSNDELVALCSAGSVLQTKRGEPTVIRHSDSEGSWITKVWIRRRSLSSDWLYPYQRRFCKNAVELRRRGIDAPSVVRFGDVIGTLRRYATYRFIEGESLRAIARRGEDVEPVALATFVAKLHANGVYFRSLHFGNLLRTGAQTYAVVDVTDVTFHARPLSTASRGRNLSFLLSYPDDNAALGSQGAFLAAYHLASGPMAGTEAALEDAIEHASWRRPARRRRPAG